MTANTVPAQLTTPSLQAEGSLPLGRPRERSVLRVLKAGAIAACVASGTSALTACSGASQVAEQCEAGLDVVVLDSAKWSAYFEKIKSENSYRIAQAKKYGMPHPGYSLTVRIPGYFIRNDADFDGIKRTCSSAINSNMYLSGEDRKVFAVIKDIQSLSCGFDGNSPVSCASGLKSLDLVRVNFMNGSGK